MSPGTASQSTPTPVDEALLSRYRKGDLQAFNQLYQRHEGPLYRYILRMVQAHQVAADLFQEVWLQLVRPDRPQSDPERFAPWLYTVARHRVLDHLKLLKNQVWEMPEEVGEPDEAASVRVSSPAPQADLADLVHRRRMAQAMLEAVQGLPVLQREAFVLQAETGLRIEEIAQMTDSPVETVRSRLRYARNSLRRQLEAWR